MLKKMFLSVFIMFLPLMLFSNKFYLDDGTIIEGKIIDTSSDTTTIKTDFGLLNIKKGSYYNSRREYKKALRLRNTWKRHFFDITGSIGISVSAFHLILLPIGGSFGYQYAFNPIFAFGGGISFLLTIFPNPNANFISMMISQSTVMGTLLFMVGDLGTGKVAFVFDIGVGYGFSTKIGLYIKGFLVKLGWNISSPFCCFVGTQSFTLDIGYKINWQRKS